jgi:flagellar hook-basal body complex protein FliE
MASFIPSLGSLGSLGSLDSLSQASGIGSGPAAGGDGEGFGSVLKTALAQVNQLSGGAEQQVGSMLTGGSADVSQVMVAVEKADVAFQLMMQVRNKIVNAYQDIEKMQF